MGHKRPARIYSINTFCCLTILLLYFYTKRDSNDNCSHKRCKIHRCPILENSRKQFISECNCSRSYFYPAPGKHSVMLNSTCSDEGTRYTAGQSVFTFAMWYNKTDIDKGLENWYKRGIVANVENITELYPGSSMRIYTDWNLGGDYCKFMCTYPNLFWCDVRKSPSLGDITEVHFSLWRFVALGDPTVDRFMSRDLDSVVIEREVPVIWDWMRTNKAFHLMRDKLFDHKVEMLAGLWGGRNNLLGKDAPILRKEMMDRSGSKAEKWLGLDQEVLLDVIYYPRKDDIVAYDSYHCDFFRNQTENRPFPMQRKNKINDFVGSCDLFEYELEKCPVECRPSYGKDWEYC